jgi:hypothetical protein
MNELLKLALSAHGGLERWQQMQPDRQMTLKRHNAKA